MDFSETGSSVNNKRSNAGSRKLRRRRVIGIVSLLVGLGVVIFGLVLMVPDLRAASDYHKLSERVHGSDDDKDDPEDHPSDEGASDASSEAPGEVPVDVPAEVDMNAVHEEIPNAIGWLSVENTPIDYPVVQGEDNEYYLHHDAFNRESALGVFLDYRVQPDGKAIIIYSHTHATEEGFHAVAEVDEQWSFDTIGKVKWSTFGSGLVEFTPLMGLHVMPDFYDIQEFEFEPSSAAVREGISEILASHVARGEWNTTTLTSFDILGTNCVKVEPACGPRPGIEYWWRMTEEEEARVNSAAETESMRAWLTYLLSQSGARAANADELIAGANRVLTLSCCSWPFDDHRTLLVCVA